MSVLLVDNSSELWHSELKKLNIECLNLPFKVDGKEMLYDNGETFRYDRFSSDYRKGLKVEFLDVTTDDYVEKLSVYLDQNEDVLYLCVSEKLSTTRANLNEAIDILKEKYPKNTVTLVDTENASMGYGAIAYEVGIMHKRGATDSEIIERVESLKNEIVTYAVIDDTNILKDTQKLSSTQHVVGSALGVKSIVTVTNMGELEIIEKLASKKKAVLKLYDKIRQEGVNIKDYPIGIAYIGDKANAELLRDKIVELVGEDATIWLQPMSPINSIYLGYGAVVLSYHVGKKRY